MSPRHQALVIVLALGALTAYFVKRKPNIIPEVRFTNLPNLGAKHINQPDYNKLLKVHQSCFDQVNEDKLLAYQLHKSGKSKASAVEKRQIKDRMERIRLSSVMSFRRTVEPTIAWYKGSPIGLYSCEDHDEIMPGAVILHNVCVHESYRGHGVGTLLTKHAIKKCMKKNRPFVLTVYKDDKPVIDLYKKHGFVEPKLEKPLPNEFYYFDKIFMVYQNSSDQ